MDAQKLLLETAEGVAPMPFEIPGARGDFRIQILNEDAARGVVTSIVHLPPGGRIPAHFHRAGAEMHYVLDGDLIEAGQALGPGPSSPVRPVGCTARTRAATGRGCSPCRAGSRARARSTSISPRELRMIGVPAVLAAGGSRAAEAAEGDPTKPAGAEQALGKGYG
jgi:hypothetical protein